MKDKIGYLALIVAVIALAFVFVKQPREGISSVKKQTVFERVTRTGTLRCGYLLAPAWVMKDPNTGAMSGTIVDYVNALGDALKLKVVWQEEINLGTYLQDLQNSRYDIECSGGWPNAVRGKQVDYSTPIYYFPLYGAVRIDDRRFDNNYVAMNNPSVRIADQDGATSYFIRTQRFPAATADDLPGADPEIAPMEDVAANKADVAFDDLATINGFIKNNPDKLRRLEGEPLRIIPANLSFAPDPRFQQMINTATNELIYDGVIEQIVSKYEPVPGAFLRVALPYNNVSKQ